MELPAACASCAMPTADKSSHSAAGMLHPYHIDGTHNNGMYCASIVSMPSHNKNTLP